MKYKLIGENDFIFSPQQTILNNRGIKDLDNFLNIDESVLYDYRLLDNIDKAVDCLDKHINNGSNILLVVDSDADGYCSASLIHNYLKQLKSKLNTKINLQFVTHKGKQHGIDDIDVSDDIDLVLITDAGTNDANSCKKLQERGIEVLILDHHQQEKKNDYAIIVNNQICDYPNKNLSGVGITYKFCKALDDYYKVDFADNYLDLVAVGNVADSMDIREDETRYYVYEGLKESNIKNKFLKALIEKQSYSMKGEVNPHTVGFYIAPLVNAVCRVGTVEEKINMFKAFIETDEKIMYQPRGKDKDIIEVYLINDMTRQCTNIKNRQNRSRDKGIDLLYNQINVDDKVIIINADKKFESGLSGLVANQFAQKYKRPVLIVREHKGTLSGSMRGYDKGEIKDFKQVLLDTDLMIFAQGHANASGVGFKIDNLDKLRQSLNNRFKDISCDNIFEVDFVLNQKDFDKDLARDIHELRNIWCRGIDEPYVVIENATFYSDNISLIGANKNTIKIIDNGIEYMKFRSDEETYMKLVENGVVTMNIVGRVGINEFRGNETAQVIIEDFEIIG